MDLFNNHTSSIEPVNYHHSTRATSALYDDWFNLSNNEVKVDETDPRETKKSLTSFDNHHRELKSSESSPSISLEWLPAEIIYRILSFCNNQTLSALSGTCSRLYSIIIYDDYVWRSKASTALTTNCNSSKFSSKSLVNLTNRDKCAVESRWKRGIFQETILIQNKKPLIPWLSIDSSNLWLTRGNTLCKFQRLKDGRIKMKPSMKLHCHQDDILKFKVTHNFIATGSLDGNLSIWNKHSGNLLSIKYKAHSSVINSVDCLHQRFMVTGSKDRTAKIWKLDFEGGGGGYNNANGEINNDSSVIGSAYNCSLTCSQSIAIGDRALSVSCSEDRDWVAIGTAGCTTDKPIVIFDVTGNRMIGALEDGPHRHGAGVLGIQWEDSNTLLSCGYDTFIRLWDLRYPEKKCVLKWEDPHDSAIYCLATDHWVTILSGTCRYGVVRLWDKRKAKQCIQMYYGRCENSPVYSLDFDPCYLYIALDKSINLMDFRLGSHAKKHC